MNRRESGHFFLSSHYHKEADKYTALLEQEVSRRVEAGSKVLVFVEAALILESYANLVENWEKPGSFLDVLFDALEEIRDGNPKFYAFMVGELLNGEELETFTWKEFETINKLQQQYPGQVGIIFEGVPDRDYRQYQQSYRWFERMMEHVTSGYFEPNFTQTMPLWKEAMVTLADTTKERNAWIKQKIETRIADNNTDIVGHIGAAHSDIFFEKNGNKFQKTHLNSNGIGKFYFEPHAVIVRKLMWAGELSEEEWELSLLAFYIHGAIDTCRDFRFKDSFLNIPAEKLVWQLLAKFNPAQRRELMSQIERDGVLKTTNRLLDEFANLSSAA